MKIKITLTTDNDAFGGPDTCGRELARILTEYSQTFKNTSYWPGRHDLLFDANGNEVGQVKVTR